MSESQRAASICEYASRDGQLKTFAGLYDTWHDKAEGKNIQSCAMVITEPNKLVGEVHDRMPSS